MLSIIGPYSGRQGYVLYRLVGLGNSLLLVGGDIFDNFQIKIVLYSFPTIMLFILKISKPLKEGRCISFIMYNITLTSLV